MPPAIKRLYIILTLVAFAGFGVFCVLTHGPLIQQEILARCQDQLQMRGIPLEGLSVDGRDVTLRGPERSRITSAPTQSLLAAVNGVRVVRVALSPSGPAANAAQSDFSNGAAQRELQDKIDRVLENQDIAFIANGSALTPESEKVLKNISAYLADVPGLRCEIRVFENHPRESRQSSVRMLQLALATEDYLVSQGVEEWRLSTHAFRVGEEQAGEATGGERKRRPVDLIVRAR